METGARARGLAGWARGCALGDGVPGRWVAAARVPGAHTRMTAGSGRVLLRRAGLSPAPTDGSDDDARWRAMRNSNRQLANY